MYFRDKITTPDILPHYKPGKERRRINYLMLIIFVITLGLSSRWFSKQFPGWMELYVGDTLWALNVFLMLGFIFTRKSSLWIAGIAYTFSFLIELSQLYHAPWIDNLRSHQFIAIIIGFGFLWSDLVCYFAGIAFGVILENLTITDKFLFRKEMKNPPGK
jgi:hypothetical protein